MLPRSSVVSCFDPSLLSFSFPPSPSPSPSAACTCLACFVFVCSIWQSENIWGPFLIISPASTLNNWHQEFSRFVAKFKVSVAAVQGNTCTCNRSLSLALFQCPSLYQTCYKPTELRLFSEQWKMCFFLAFAYFCCKETHDRLLHFWSNFCNP